MDVFGAFGSAVGCFFLFRPAYSPPLCAGAGLGNRATHRTVDFLCSVIYRPAISSQLIVGGDLYDLWHRTVRLSVFFFSAIQLRLTPIARVAFSRCRRHILDSRWQWFSLTFFLFLTGRPPILPLSLVFFLGLVASLFRGVGVGFDEPHLRLVL